MDIGLEWIWKSSLIVLGGTVLLRVAGRKSISQMTLAQVVIMIGIGSLLIQPLAGENIWSTLFVGAMLVITLIIIELVQLKFDFVEQLITGTSKILIKDGELQISNLKKVRLTVDQLETQLRQRNVSKISDIKWATLEPNGQIGYILKDNAKHATKEDIALLKQDLTHLKQMIDNQRTQPAYNNMPYQGKSSISQNVPPISPSTVYKLNQQITELTNKLQAMSTASSQDLFSEVEHKSHTTPPPKGLQ